jgi:LAO/AO transport system kinase
MNASESIWIPPIQKTVSVDGQGIPELVDRISSHAAYLHSTGGWLVRDQTRLAAETETILQQVLMDQFHAREPQTRYNRILQAVFQRSLSPWEAVARLTRAGPANGRPAEDDNGAQAARNNDLRE